MVLLILFLQLYYFKVSKLSLHNLNDSNPLNYWSSDVITNTFEIIWHKVEENIFIYKMC